MMTRYRNEIDGLRAIAVIAVIFFHFGYLPNGLLGVDVFFVISGFLITKIIYKEITQDNFSIQAFYIRRIRRILPLVLLVCFVALIIGVITMLPDDLENLAQSVIATNLFSNNILLSITTKDYWAVANEYKPLMHTWSLGVEEQYYLLYPFLFTAIGKKRIKFLLPVLSISAGISFLIFLIFQYQDIRGFYPMYIRFWELAVGGIAAIILKDRLLEYKYPWIPIVLLVLVLGLNLVWIQPPLLLIASVLLTVAILSSSNKQSQIAKSLLANRWMVGIGKISFSLYLWHQILLAYSRYFWANELQLIHFAGLSVLTVLLSLTTYYLIEKPFRNKDVVPKKWLLIVVGLCFCILMSFATYIYIHAGVLRDVPELGIMKSNIERNMHAKYNDRVYSFDRNFVTTNKIKVLVIGNSFARDWANVLLESKYSDKIEISYMYEPVGHKDLQRRTREADVIFYSTPTLEEVRRANLPKLKLWILGTKNFGYSNGIFYNYNGSNYYAQRTKLQPAYIESNLLLQKIWGDRYLDFIGKVIDANQSVPVFTPSKQFISQDCIHFTKAGTKYYAKLFEKELDFIFQKKKSLL